MAAEVAFLVLVPNPIFLFNSAQNPAFTAERPWFLTYNLDLNWAKRGLVNEGGGRVGLSIPFKLVETSRIPLFFPEKILFSR